MDEVMPIEVRDPELGALLVGYVSAYERKEVPNFDTVLKDFYNTGRNELCPCNSGKKFKKCHGGTR